MNSGKNADNCKTMRTMNGTQNKDENLKLEKVEFWDKLLSLDQWYYFGKEFKYEVYESALLASDQRQRIYYPPSKFEIMRKNADALEKKRITKNDRYLFAEDILPVFKSKGKNVAPVIDLQALDLVVQELSRVPFDEERFEEFLRKEDDNNNFNTNPLNIVGGLIAVKRNMTTRDWLALRDLYVEFKVLGFVSVSKVYITVLEMVCRASPNPGKWYTSAKQNERLAALKLGTLLLNLFNFCYTDAIKMGKKANVVDEEEVSKELLSEKHLGLMVDYDQNDNSDSTHSVNKSVNVSSSTVNAKKRPVVKVIDRKKFTKAKSYLQPPKSVGNRSSYAALVQRNVKKAIMRPEVDFINFKVKKK